MIVNRQMAEMEIGKEDRHKHVLPLIEGNHQGPLSTLENSPNSVTMNYKHKSQSHFCRLAMTID